MNEARAYRRVKETEEQKLANRLALLKSELAKSQKKVAETEARAKAIENNRQELIQRHKDREASLKHHEEETRKATELHGKGRITFDVALRHKVRNARLEKKAKVKEILEEKQRAREYVDMTRMLEQKRAADLSKKIRDDRAKAKAKREKELELKREAARRQFNERVKREQERSKECEENIKEMEKEELQLIKELEKAQNKQRTAFKQLQQKTKETREILDSQPQKYREEGFSYHKKKKKKGRKPGAAKDNMFLDESSSDDDFQL